ncbi:hypothetical protein EI74_0140 [Mycoplasma testudineum]|uniref:Uncharacterized protein n=1 Tax=Mycoplasma testudineum TaxID=244584 RepID=A0A4R6IFJ3_9MOLU|nr:hypothetical protein [Mycoplasma testudineum]TDO21120.1 hypothetical protein EI74_0140 [Mycoplasma testudineum]
MILSLLVGSIICLSLYGIEYIRYYAFLGWVIGTSIVWLIYNFNIVILRKYLSKLTKFSYFGVYLLKMIVVGIIITAVVFINLFSEIRLMSSVEIALAPINIFALIFGIGTIPAIVIIVNLCKLKGETKSGIK